MLVAASSEPPEFLSALSADISVRVPRNAWLKGQDVSAEIAGDIAIRKEAGESFVLIGPLSILRGNFYFMGKSFRLTEGDVEFLGLKDINPNLSIETQTRIKSVTIIATIHGSAQEMMIDLSSDPAMDESDIISYLVFGRGAADLSGNQAFSVEKTALSYTSGLLAAELRTLLGDAAFIDTFSIDAGSGDRSFGAVTLGKYITPEIFISHRQGLSENEPSYQEITYELTPQIRLETQIGKDQASSADITWEFDF
jgi:translocation and assembly module TamB